MQWRRKLLLTICSLRINRIWFLFVFVSFSFYFLTITDNREQLWNQIFKYRSISFWIDLFQKLIWTLVCNYHYFKNIYISCNWVAHIHNVTESLSGRRKRDYFFFFQSELFCLSFCSHRVTMIAQNDLDLYDFNLFIYRFASNHIKNRRRRNKEKLNNSLGCTHHHTRYTLLLSKRIDNSKNKWILDQIFFSSHLLEWQRVTICLSPKQSYTKKNINHCRWLDSFPNFFSSSFYFIIILMRSDHKVWNWWCAMIRQKLGRENLRSWIQIIFLWIWNLNDSVCSRKCFELDVCALTNVASLQLINQRFDVHSFSMETFGRVAECTD